LQDEQRPAFNEPWQAEAYALVQVLIETGRISPPEWAQAFGAALREAATEGEPDSGDTYYASLSDALERVLMPEGADTRHSCQEAVLVVRYAMLNRLGRQQQREQSLRPPAAWSNVGAWFQTQPAGV
jgi:nitrile hydratase accessory protein